MGIGPSITICEGTVLETTGGVFLRWGWDHKWGTRTLQVSTTSDLSHASVNPDPGVIRELGRLGQTVVRRHRVKVERVVSLLPDAERALEPSPRTACRCCGVPSCNGECI